MDQLLKQHVLILTAVQQPTQQPSQQLTIIWIHSSGIEVWIMCWSKYSNAQSASPRNLPSTFPSASPSAQPSTPPISALTNLPNSSPRYSHFQRRIPTNLRAILSIYKRQIWSNQDRQRISNQLLNLEWYLFLRYYSPKTYYSRWLRRIPTNLQPILSAARFWIRCQHQGLTKSDLSKRPGWQYLKVPPCKLFRVSNINISILQILKQAY